MSAASAKRRAVTSVAQPPAGACGGCDDTVDIGPDPTASMSWPQLFSSWYRGEEIDAGEAQALWIRTAAALAGIWALSYLRPG